MNSPQEIFTPQYEESVQDVVEHYGSSSSDNDWQFWLLFVALLLISVAIWWAHYKKGSSL